ncbi:hypothetical protein O6H91_Y406400 [Diphasiastrum complanatum]|nr:hypothetical protein O6H91_Y406400 [Diphasiastrum complanatum]
MGGNSTTSMAEQALSQVGLGYGIAIAVGILLLMSTVMLASYVCLKVHRGHSFDATQGALTGTAMGAHLQGHSAATEWPAAGLDQETLETYPKIVYSPQRPLPRSEDTSCSICLADYNDEEVLRMLPDCGHVFHALCSDSWLRLHATCPMCRSSPLPTPQSTPVSTPLSELIPLARNPLQSHMHQSTSR